MTPPAVTGGILPGPDRTWGNPYLTVVVASGLGEHRNAVEVTAADGVVAVGGNPGTLIEIGYALHG